MRSLLAHLKTLVLPGGATTGRRIVLDGPNATINFFDSTGFFFGTLTTAGGFPGYFVFGNDGSQVALQKENASGETQIENLTVANVFRIANARIETDTVQAAAGPVGAIVGKLEIFDDTGASLGFLPVYDTIT